MTDQEYQEEWEELDPKVLLVQLLAEQQKTNQLLEQLTDDDPIQDEATPMYECQYCVDTTVKKDNRQRHAESEHNTPPGEWESAFERVS